MNGLIEGTRGDWCGERIQFTCGNLLCIRDLGVFCLLPSLGSAQLRSNTAIYRPIIKVPFYCFVCLLQRLHEMHVIGREMEGGDRGEGRGQRQAMWGEGFIMYYDYAY